MWRVWLLSLIGMFALLGCRDNKGIVTGAVTFDGQPVGRGMITFVKQDGDVLREGAIIQDGRFLAHLPPGEYKIELNAQKVISKRKQKGFDGKDEEVEITDELFPQRYNAKTTLTAKIGPGPNTVDLDAKAK
jgi:hypothetical protein